MKAEQINSLIRTLLTLAGAFLTGGGVTYFFGHVIDTAYWEEITGTLMAAISIYWSIRTKTVDIEKLQGFVRQIVTFICGILVAKGVLNEQTSLAVLAFVAAIIPYIQAGLARKKSEQLASGEIQLHQLKMNTKVLKAIAVFMLLSCAVHAQNFFKPIPKIQPSLLKVGRPGAINPAVLPDSTFFAVRPIMSAVTLFVDGTVEAAAGGGISYQNITQRGSDGRNYVNYAFSALVLAGGSVIPDKPGDIEKFGFMVSALNNTVGLGYGLSHRTNVVTGEKKWKGGLMVSWSFNFNN